LILIFLQQLLHFEQHHRRTIAANNNNNCTSTRSEIKSQQQTCSPEKNKTRSTEKSITRSNAKTTTKRRALHFGRHHSHRTTAVSNPAAHDTKEMTTNRSLKTWLSLQASR
jgi:hypothetical protein